MSLDKEIRDAFDQMASEVRSGEPALPRTLRRAERHVRRRRARFAALAAALVIAAGVGVPRLMEDGLKEVTFLPPSPDASPSSSITSPSPSPSPEETAKGSPPPKNVPPASLDVDLSLPSGLDTAEIVEARVRIRDGAGSVSQVTALWGDNPDENGFGTVAPLCAPPIGPAPATDDTRVLRHAYRTPGTYTVRIQVMTGHCQKTAAETVEVQGRISIGQGAEPSNGPLGPTVHIEDRRHLYDDGASDEATFYLGGGDEDGYVRKVVVDYGDGTTEVLVDAPLTECEEPEGRWPSTYLVGQEVTHTYPPGTYTLTVTVISVGCDGLDEQRRKGSFEVRSPG